ncbi:MAG: hypothetical protein LBU20_01160, partial [Candidatus Nomurabacteria bacterium]|nr:hypothetical protein [Candidatus Nomurabacteria bacterium]
MTSDIIAGAVTRMLILAGVAALLSMIITPIFTYFAYKYKLWKKQRSDDVSGEKLKVFNSLHAHKFRRNIPTMAGLIFVITIALTTLIFNFSYNTYLPLAALVFGGVVGLIDDIFNLVSDGIGKAGMRPWLKFTLMTLAGLAFGWFFYSFLGVSAVKVPFDGALELGIW